MRLLPKKWLDHDLKDLASRAPIQWLDRSTYTQAGVRVGIKREDLLCPLLGGNKFYKLYYHLKACQQQDCSVIATFGGAYSNHLYALAAAGRELGLATIGFVRGNYHKKLSPTLLDAQAFGMKLEFLSTQDYQRKESLQFLEDLDSALTTKSLGKGQIYWIPEGGAGDKGIKGPAVLGRVIQAQTHENSSIHTATGTGTTALGIAVGAPQCPVTGYVMLKLPALKQDTFTQCAYIQSMGSEVKREAPTNLNYDYRFHCGGYAKFPPFLKEFMQDFEKETKIVLDPVYTAKLLWSIEQRCLSKEIAPGQTLILVHTGGLQGRRGFDLCF